VSFEFLNLLLWIDIELNWISSTVEDDLIVEEMDSSEVVDDFELGNDEAVNIHIKDKEVNKQKLRRRINHRGNFRKFLSYLNLQATCNKILEPKE